MAITVTWSVLDMKRDAATGGVKEVRWQCVAEADTGESAVEAGKLLLEPDATAEDFIAYEDLTEEVVLGWVKGQEGFDADEIETNRTGKVEAQIARNTAEATGMPWATEATE
jgi:hypothetical protein